MFANVQPQFTTVESLRDHLVMEIFKAVGLRGDGWARHHFEKLFYPPCTAFSEIALTFDRTTCAENFAAASQEFLTHFVRDVQARGVEAIPATGPLLILSNHPGAYDSVVISSFVKRDDYKIIVSDIPFLAGLPNAAKHFIFTSDDPHVRMATMRAALRYLLDGGALLIFPTGKIDPDPALWRDTPEAHLDNWSPSLEMFLRKVPETRTVITTVSGILSARWAKHPLTWLRRAGIDRRRLAEFGQVIEQLLRPGLFYARPAVSFAPSSHANANSSLAGLTGQAKELMASHRAYYNLFP